MSDTIKVELSREYIFGANGTRSFKEIEFRKPKVKELRKVLGKLVVAETRGDAIFDLSCECAVNVFSNEIDELDINDGLKIVEVFTENFL